MKTINKLCTNIPYKVEKRKKPNRRFENEGAQIHKVYFINIKLRVMEQMIRRRILGVNGQLWATHTHHPLRILYYDDKPEKLDRDAILKIFIITA